jgi:hypothetical protein
MQITATLDYGPLEIEVSSDEREEVQQNLLEIVEFLEESGDALEEVEIQPRAQASQTELDSSEWTDNDPQQSTANDSPLSGISKELGVSAESLEEIVYVDSDGEERPQVMIDGDELGDSVPETQLNAALIILTVSEECYGEEVLDTSEFKDILALSGISESNLYRAWDESLINQSGKGNASTITLKGPGRREAKKLLCDIAESVSE